MSYDKVIVPRDGEKVTVNADLSFNVPNHPIIPFIEGDGIGVDITPVMIKVVDAAVEKAYKGKNQSFGWKYIVAKKPLTSMMAPLCQKRPLKFYVTM